MKKQTPISENKYQAITNKICQLIRSRKEAGIEDPKHIILDNISLCELLKVSARTVQHWRTNKLIAYSKIGNIIVYRMNDIQAFLDKYYNPIKK